MSVERMFIMRRVWMAAVLITILVFPMVGQAKPGVSAQNAVLIEQSSGRILFAKNAHEKQPIASITKIMTAIIAIESGKMQETVTASKRAVHIDGSSIYLKQGETMKMEDLVYGLMLRSGNDAAIAISEHIGGSVEGFVHLMNEKARWLGMTNTHFSNPHGLDEDKHYSTAYDMAILMQYAMTNEQFQTITKAQTYKAETRSYAWQNKNKLLTSYYKYCTGGKTGFTSKSGRTLVSSASKKNMDLIAVTLNAPDDWRDHIGMYEWAYEKYSMHTLAEKGEKLYLLDHTDESITGYLYREKKYPLSDREFKTLHTQSMFYQIENIKQDIIGKTVFYLDSEPIEETMIYANEIPQEQESIFTKAVSIYKQIVKVE